MPADFVQLIATDKRKTVSFILTNYLFHIPLYGYFIFTIDLYDDDDIEGVMMSTVFESEGPFTFTLASELVQMKLDNADKNV